MMVDKKFLENRIGQCLFENATWIRIIDFLSQENTIMKNRLSEVIDHILDRNDLALAEHYQNQFIIKDDLFDHMLHDLQAESNKWTNPSFISSQERFNELEITHKQLRGQMDFIERDIAIIRNDYNSFLSKVILAFDSQLIK